MNKIFKNLEIIFKPSYWSQTGKFSKEVDDAINYLLDNFEFTDISECTAKIGGKEIWVANHPYSSFRLNYYPFKELRPSRKTILKAKKALFEKEKPIIEKSLKHLPGSTHH